MNQLKQANPANPVRQLSLEKCTKSECKPCDFGYILKDYVKPIMQCVTNDIPSYYMRLLTTKCLNTSVLISFFMLGKKGVKIADRCDSNEVQKKHKEGIMNNSDLLESLKKSILHKQCKYRQLYYILITDAEFSHDDGNTRHFPGHVFIIEKIPKECSYCRRPGHHENDCLIKKRDMVELNPKYMEYKSQLANNGKASKDKGEPLYYFHQSYINKYDYNGHIKRNNNSLIRSWKEVKEMIHQILYVIQNPTWDENSVKYWTNITFVNTDHLLGAKSGGKMFLCWKKSQVIDCVDRLEEYTKTKLKQLSKFKPSEMNEIYGDKNAYDDDQKPMTRKEIKKSLTKLLSDIAKNKQISQTK